MTGRAPERIRWAVERLDVQPDDHILELGCGPGVAAALVAERLDGGDGQLVAIDRSATAVERARARTAGHVAAGRVDVRQVALAGFDADTDRFDKAFGVNVNLFWTSPADAEIAVLARVLRPGGIVHLVYEGPPGGDTHPLGPGIAAKPERHRFTTEVGGGPPDAPSVLCVTARLP